MTHGIATEGATSQNPTSTAPSAKPSPTRPNQAQPANSLSPSLGRTNLRGRFLSGEDEAQVAAEGVEAPQPPEVGRPRGEVGVAAHPREGEAVAELVELFGGAPRLELVEGLRRGEARRSVNTIGHVLEGSIPFVSKDLWRSSEV